MDDDLDFIESSKLAVSQWLEKLKKVENNLKQNKNLNSTKYQLEEIRKVMSVIDENKSNSPDTSLSCRFESNSDISKSDKTAKKGIKFTAINTTKSVESSNDSRLLNADDIESQTSTTENSHQNVREFKIVLEDIKLMDNMTGIIENTASDNASIENMKITKEKSSNDYKSKPNNAPKSVNTKKKYKGISLNKIVDYAIAACGEIKDKGTINEIPMDINSNDDSVSTKSDLSDLSIENTENFETFSSTKNLAVIKENLKKRKAGKIEDVLKVKKRKIIEDLLKESQPVDKKTKLNQHKSVNMEIQEEKNIVNVSDESIDTSFENNLIIDEQIPTDKFNSFTSVVKESAKSDNTSNHEINIENSETKIYLNSDLSDKNRDVDLDDEPSELDSISTISKTEVEPEKSTNINKLTVNDIWDNDSDSDLSFSNRETLKKSNTNKNRTLCDNSTKENIKDSLGNINKTSKLNMSDYFSNNADNIFQRLNNEISKQKLSNGIIEYNSTEDSANLDIRISINEKEKINDNDEDYILIPDSNSDVEIIHEKDYVLKNFSLVLNDVTIERPDLKEEAEEIYCNFLDKEYKRLSKIPTKINKQQSQKKSAIKTAKSRKNKWSRTSDSPEDNSNLEVEISDSDSNNSKTGLNIIELSANNLMENTTLSSTDTGSNDRSSDESVKFSHVTKHIKKSKNKAGVKRVTRSIKLPKLSSDEDGDEGKMSVDSNENNSKKKALKRKADYCSLSSDKSESDGSVTDLRLKIKTKLKNSKSKQQALTNLKNRKTEKSATQKADEEEVETRKNIHKIIDTSKLSEATKTAAQLEVERRKRIEEKQKLYNESLDETKNSSNIEESLIFEKDDDDNVIVEVHKDIVKHLKPHQVEAVKFIWDCVVESVACLNEMREKKEKKELEKHNDENSDSESDETNNQSAVGGCILAHCMGLGKTLSLISFMHTMLTCSVLKFKTCLVVCPVNTALNWKREWLMWMPQNKKKVKIYEVSSTESKKNKLEIIQNWISNGGVLIIGYEMYRCLASGDARMIRRKALRKRMIEALVNPGPDFVVCDEGHLLKNHKSAISRVISKIKTRRRIVLTGTPLQNKLLEYHTMVQFVKPNLLGTQKEFLNRFVNPINNGQHIDSTEYDVKVMKKRSHILFKTLDGCVHRRDYCALVKYLPPKYEYIIKIRLSDIQVALYRRYLSSVREMREKNRLFQDQLNLARIWTHPYVICMHQEIQDKKMLLADTDVDSFINDETDYDEDAVEDLLKPNTAKDDKPDLGKDGVIRLVSDDDVVILDESSKPIKTKKNGGSSVVDEDCSAVGEGSESESADEVVRNWSTSRQRGRQRAGRLQDSGDEALGNNEQEATGSHNDEDKEQHWWSDIIKPEHEHEIEVSGKLAVLFQILRKASDIGDKVIIFSQSLLVLDIIEKYLFELNQLQERLSQEFQQMNESLYEQEKRQKESQEAAAGDTEEKDGNLTEINKSPTEENGDMPTKTLLADLANKKNSAYISDLGYNSWVRGVDYDRMDGSTQAVTRVDIQNKFNAEADRRLRLFLISTRAGGMGINLVAANRVVIFDVSWNPSHDVQAIFRTYRFGQVKPVYVYRFVAQGSMEEKIYDRQVMKQSLALRVVDEQQISRHFTEEDLRTLYRFEPDIYDVAGKRETPILPRDRLLAELMHDCPRWLYNYHEHDSLLQKATDEEELTEDERREAWREFEEEKERGPNWRSTAANMAAAAAAASTAGMFGQHMLLPTSNLTPEQLVTQQNFDRILQLYPAISPLYAQNFEYLSNFVLNQKPDLKFAPYLLNLEIKSVFMRSLTKLYNFKPDLTSGGPLGAVPGVASGTNPGPSTTTMVGNQQTNPITIDDDEEDDNNKPMEVTTTTSSDTK